MKDFRLMSGSANTQGFHGMLESLSPLVVGIKPREHGETDNDHVSDADIVGARLTP